MTNPELDITIQGNLVLPEEIAKNRVVGVKNGIITGIYEDGAAPTAAEHLREDGRLIFPGLIDAHVHSYSNIEEGLEHSTAAAAAGGVTTIIEMPYDQNAPVVTPDVFQSKIELIRHRAKVDVALLATLTKGGNVEAIAPMAGLGACGFKLSLFETDAERFPRIEDEVLYQVLPRIAEHGLPVGFHAENDRIIEALIARFKTEGKTYPKAHPQTRPPISESLAVIKLLEFAYWFNIKLHVYHVSHPRCLELIDWYRRQGVDVSVETCPHYLIFNEDDMDRLKSLLKINPPIRQKQEVEQMWQAVKTGRIDFITTDHAPWPWAQKQKQSIFENASGAPGLETSLALMYTHGVVNRGMNPVELAGLLCEKPAKRFRLTPRKGRIVVGADADFAVFNPETSWIFDAARSQTSSKWSPYDGMFLKGRVEKTILRGKIIFKDGKVMAEEGDGRYIPATRK